MSSNRNDSASSESLGRFAYDGLDRVIHEKARLGIIASLATHVPGLLFNELKDLCSLTDGNLSRHLSVLIEARIVHVWKEQRDGRQQTMHCLTTEGRRRFLDYVSILENVVMDAQNDARDVQPRQGIQRWSPA